MFKEIYDHLKVKELDPYFIGQHKGDCKSPYVVIKEGSSIPSITSNYLGRRIIDIILYVPSESFIEMDLYEKKIKTGLKDLKYLRRTGSETPPVPDDGKKAYTKSIEYILQRKAGDN